MKSLIVAVDDAWGIGKNGVLPWHIPEDLKRFKELTTGAICIMGYNSYKEIADRFDYVNTGKFLPKRISYVLTSKNIPTKPNYVETFTNIDTAVEQAEHSGLPIFFIGGAKIFEAAIPLVDSALITFVSGDYKCDVFFPYEKLEKEGFSCTITQRGNGYSFSECIRI